MSIRKLPTKRTTSREIAAASAARPVRWLETADLTTGFDVHRTQFNAIVAALARVGSPRVYLLPSSDYAMYVVIMARSHFVSRLVLERHPTPTSPYRLRHHMPFGDVTDVSKSDGTQFVQALLELRWERPTHAVIRRRAKMVKGQKAQKRRDRTKSEAAALLARRAIATASSSE